MKIVTGSRHIVADTAVALDRDGQEHLVVVAKGTWSIPDAGQRPRPLAPQPLAQADVYLGDPGLSPMLYGADYARFKPRCDVLFDASAHAPDGVPVAELLVACKVGALEKGMRVVGPRTWRSTLGFVSIGEPAAFVTLPLHFGLAFGGTIAAGVGADDAAEHGHPENPAGIGWAGGRSGAQLHGTPAPSLEAVDDPVRSPQRRHAPIALSAIARHWMPRRTFAGTYDEQWRRNVFPLLPDDYDEAFNQCAPADQQIDYPHGGEPVVLRNMMAGRPDVRFALPRLDNQSVRILRTDYTTETLPAHADTLYFEPDAGRFSVVWRACTLIHRRVQEFDTVAVGPVDPSWWSRLVLGQDGSGCAGCGEAEAMEART